ncbi:hypothetical protein BKA25_000438 [Actinoalloteichus hymeniacidonis]|uniref:DUF5753 domain-containing protein n=2 Tax=Actinoalloteichus hymeniacidonis TaxID=340345 RepID=A0AAC9HU76_9PSEU|nr:hypothetical protein TL08_25045 [Actinoalloteichus hymeniacidonis]MBB5906122.1 hypothetical protein [Actinoalloteichus hymeniacidonis]
MRTDAGIEIEQVMAEMGWSLTTTQRKETARDALSTSEVHALCMLYGVPAEQRVWLVDLAGRLDDPGWWTPYSDVVSDGFRDYLELESEAVEVRNFEIDLIPGLLQTESYIRALVESWNPAPPAAITGRRVALRLARQQRLLTGELRLWAILDEAVLRPRIVTGPQWISQLAALREFAGHPNITLQVLPFSAGPHTAMGSPFAWLRLPAPDPGTVLFDNVAGSVTVEDTEPMRRFHEAFHRLTTTALSANDSRAFLADLQPH